LGWRLEAIGYDLLAFWFRLLPIDLASWLGGRVARLVGPFTTRHRIAELNIGLAFPELEPTARARILTGFWDNFGRSAAEFMHMKRLVPGSSRVEIVGDERLRALAASRSPAVLVSGHLANFEVMMAAILRLGAPSRVAYRPANNPYAETRINKVRRAYGVTDFAAKGGGDAREILRTLKSGGWFAVLNDQRDDGGVEAPFFGHMVRAAPGPARLALTFGGRLYPVSVVRKGGANFRVTFHEPIELHRTGNASEDIRSGVAQMNAFLEGVIRENPAQWLWSHRRWPLELYGPLNRKGRT